MSGQTHVIGAGLAGLSAALALMDAGRKVVLYEAGTMAGGRCRSYQDRSLGLTVDNGNHLLLSGNKAAFAFLDRIGSRATMGGPDDPVFPFIDIPSGDRWTVRPNRGRLPWWILSPSRRVPGTSAADYLRLLGLGFISDDRSVAAALNTGPDAGLASLLGAVVRETLMLGGAACIPRFPRDSLAASLIDPALAALRRGGAGICFSRRVIALEIAGNRVTALHDPDGPVALTKADSVVLAVPPWIAAGLLPGLRVPDQFEAILNVHFRAEADPGQAGFIGLVGGTAEWVFVKPGHVSVTISAANHMVDLPPGHIAATVWPDVRMAVGLSGEMPPYRVIKEKRATFAATAAQGRKRPSARTGLVNLALAGDWIATALPATIEGAIRSGARAARIILAN
jgi:glycine/D-amino acid oxidase-like deaminating enzyme